VGGNLFSYPLSDKIPEIFEDKKAQIHFWSHYKNFRPSEHPVIWDIVVDFPVDEQVLSNCIAGGMQETAQYHYHFIVQNEGEINLVEKMTAHFDIQDFEMHPYYNGANFDFFKNCIFLNRDDILSSTIAQRRIFCNQALNSNFFGSLTILSNGDVTATMNTPVLGNIFTTSLLELITKELKQNTAWRKTRNEPPCNACLFQYLCPPISNYEMTFQRQNLCTLYENG
jgi:pseudo-rSAM protein